ncbi:MAG: hypothetical protein RMY29_010445 [Nostoc sp. CreGUA01]|nr:hypothetical protein [Nostoc sp. CreGUA01]
MGHGAWGIGHWALVINSYPSLPHLPHPPHPPHSLTPSLPHLPHSPVYINLY